MPLEAKGWTNLFIGHFSAMIQCSLVGSVQYFLWAGLNFRIFAYFPRIVLALHPCIMSLQEFLYYTAELKTKVQFTSSCLLLPVVIDEN